MTLFSHRKEFLRNLETLIIVERKLCKLILKKNNLRLHLQPASKINSLFLSMNSLINLRVLKVIDIEETPWNMCSTLKSICWVAYSDSFPFFFFFSLHQTEMNWLILHLWLQQSLSFIAWSTDREKSMCASLSV